MGTKMNANYTKKTQKSSQHLKTHRLGSPQLQLGLGRLQQLLHHLQERLDEEVEVVGMARHKQLVEGIHGDYDIACKGEGEA